MAFTFSYTISGSIIIITAHGTMDQHCALRIIETFTSDPNFRTDLGICFDVRDTDYFPRYSEVSSFFQEYRERFHARISGRIAFIVESKIQFGLARMASTVLSSLAPNVEVFLSAEDGIRWLRS